MGRKPGWLLLAAFFGLLCVAGIQSFLRDISIDLKLALGELGLGIVSMVITIFSFFKFLNLDRPAKAAPSFQTPVARSKPTPPKTAAARTSSPRDPASAPRFEVQFESVEPDREVKTPKGAELSFLDAEALRFWNGKATNFEVPPYYTKTAFERNVGPALDRLLSGGYLRTSGVRQNVGLKTVPELKEVLSAKGLKVSGKKAELVQRILDNYSEQELRKLFPVGVYEITEKGAKALSVYSIIFTSQHHGLGLSYYRLLDEKARTPWKEDEDILADLLVKDMENCYKTGERAGYQITLQKAADFSFSRGDGKQALDYKILEFFMWTRDIERLPEESSRASRYFMAKGLEDYGRKLGLSFSQLVARMYKTVGEVNPFGLGSKKNIDCAVSVLKKALVLDR